MGHFGGFSSCTCVVVILAFYIVQHASRVVASTCSTVRHIGWERDPMDCSEYYMCHLGRKMGRTRQCPKSEVWSDKKKRCVIMSSKYNDCKCIDRTPFSVCVKHPCTGMFLIEYRPDPDNCNAYHVCYRGVSVNILRCPKGTRWSTTQGRCSIYSRCRNKGEGTPVPPRFYTPSTTKTTKANKTTKPIQTTTTARKTTSTRTPATTSVRKTWMPWSTSRPPTTSTHRSQRTTTTRKPRTTTSTSARTSPIRTSTSTDSVTETINSLQDCGIISTPYIVGGTPAFEGEWPWQILLKGRINATHETQCGGVLVNKKWVMTAAHCVFRTALHSADSWKIVLGEHATTYSSGREKVVRPAQIIRHEGYEPRGGFPDDIALMELPEGVDIEKRFIMPVCLPPKDFVIPEGSPCWITGWGNTDAKGQGSEVLNSLSVSVWSQKQCQMAWGDHITPHHICVGTGDTGACAGDSGGPLSCEVNGRFVVAGIASWGVPGCRTPGYPDVYTNVTAYLNWINDYVEPKLGSLWSPR